MSWMYSNEASRSGGAISATDCSVNISKSHFRNNVIETPFESGGAIHTTECSVKISRSHFSTNEALGGGAAIYAQEDTMDIDRCEFNSNKGSLGGAMTLKDLETLRISLSVFSNNEADRRGGAVYSYSSRPHSTTVAISRSVFRDNEAKNGGAIFVQRANIIISRSYFRENKAQTGVFYIHVSKLYFSDNNIFLNNTGSIFLFSSNFTTMETSNIRVTDNSSPPQESNENQQGGGITAFQSSIIISGKCILVNNHAQNGGGIHATHSKVFVYGYIVVAKNKVTNSGGGVYLYQSELNCKQRSTLVLLNNNAAVKGGGIHATSSLILMDYVNAILGYWLYSGSSIKFTSNSARLGGGLCLEVSANIYILKLSWTRFSKYAFRPLLFSANSADYGGAVYVADDTNSAMCASTSYWVYSAPTECSMQVLALYDQKLDIRFLPTLISVKTMLTFLDPLYSEDC